MTILPTKLFVPEPSNDALVRPHLLQALDASSQARLVLVSAPAGSGKTTLVATWVARNHPHAAWLSIEPSDDDPLVFLTYLIEAFRTLDASLGERAHSLVQTLPRPRLDVILATLVSDLTESALDAVLILEDYHELQNAAVHRMTTQLIERLPPSITVVIITRSDPPLPLSRLRVREQLVEIRASDLRFRPDEVRMVVEQIAGKSFSSLDLTKLTLKTEGWAAGVQLAGLAMRKIEDSASFIDAFSGTNAYVADYLADEVLATLESEDEDFLIRTSALKRMTGALCDAVLGRSDGSVVLDRLSRENMFLVPLDSERLWFRYHHLFGDLLRRRLLSRSDDTYVESVATASVWSENQGMADDAVAYAHMANDIERVSMLTARYGIQALAEGNAVTAAKWIGLLPQSLVRSSPDHCVIAAWAYSLLEQHDSVKTYASWAHQLIDSMPSSHIPNIGGHIETIWAGTQLLLGGSPAKAENDLTHIVTEVPDEDLLLTASIHVLRGNVRHMMGTYSDAIADHNSCRSAAIAADSALLRLAGSTGLALAHFCRGEIRQAIDCGLREVDERIDIRESLAGQVANVQVVLASALFEAGAIDEADTHLRQAWSRLGLNTSNDFDVSAFLDRRPTAFRSTAPASLLGFVTHTRGLIAQGMLDRAERFVTRHDAADHVSDVGRIAVDAARIRLWTARGDHELLASWLRLAPRPPVDDAFWNSQAMTTRARAAIAIGDHSLAAGSLEMLLADLDESESVVVTVEAQILLAAAQYGSTHTQKARQLVRRAIGVSSNASIVQLWIEDSASILPILQEIITLQDGSPTELAFASNVVERIFAKQTNPRNELSEREREVLRLIAAGYTNREVAERLFLATGTVKKHTHTIYQKIGVTNRAQAVLRAQELLLLSDPDHEAQNKPSNKPSATSI
jgi:LuxR family transcriptional regulator, maltose regulon positive regulatory protein